MPMDSAPVLAASGVRSAPRWSADGREVYYLASDNRMMSVQVRGNSPLAVGTPQALFELKPSDALMEVSRDGRFLLLISQVRAGERPIVVNTAAITPSP
jgi:Tol biopolymer transport system component